MLPSRRLLLPLALTLASCTVDDGDLLPDEPVDPWEQVSDLSPRSLSDNPAARALLGAALFHAPAPLSNGRSCATCHVAASGFGLAPAEVEARFRRRPRDPLFRSLDADDFDRDFTLLRTHALIRVSLPLPENVVLADDPTRRVVHVWRGVPTISNTALTLPMLQDGRADSLEAQAAGAFHGHFEPRFEPPAEVFRLIADFERTVFSSQSMRDVAAAIAAGQTPGDPDGALDADQTAGKAVFVARCQVCHGGPTGSVPRNSPIFKNVDVSALNNLGLPVQTFVFTKPDGSTETRSSADPGRALITGDVADFDRFDVPSIHGLRFTAPYFHDNSAETIEEVLATYNQHFALRNAALLTDEEMRVLATYLRKI